MIIMIAAIAENNALGKNNELLWHLPDDFKRFKTLTSGHHIIMGRKTFESLPGLLPNRTHIVVTRQKDYAPKGTIVVHSIAAALQLVPEDEDGYIIGGGEVYKLALPFADKLEITQVLARFDADAFFPEINEQSWHLAASEFHPTDEKHRWPFRYETYFRT